ncbi:hypothetical protein Hanom_Chr17g01529851 [Helianthus anomalus]
MVGEYTELLVLNCYIYKFSMILKVKTTDIRYFTGLTTSILFQSDVTNTILLITTRCTHFMP